jgi:hypothetical protein
MTSRSDEPSSDKPLTPREVSDAWLELQGADYAKDFTARVNIPDLSGLIPPDYFQKVMPVLTDFAQNISTVAAVTFPKEQLASIQQTFVRASSVILRDSVYDSYADMMRGLTPALESFAKTTALTPDIQASMSAMTTSLAASIDTSHIQSLLATASAFTADLSEEDVNERVEGFFESHPDVAGSIEQSPVLYALSREDRRLIVWLVGIIVTLYVGTTLLHIGTDNPELKAIIDAFGLDFGGGLPAGVSVAAATNKALDKLPQEETN